MTKKLIEFIKADAPDSWICICGNRPDLDGFWPCDYSGEPCSLKTGTVYYICNQCGRVIDESNLEVIRQVALPDPQRLAELSEIL